MIIGSSPLAAAVTAHFLMKDDRLTPIKIISIGLGILGVLLISLSKQPWTKANIPILLGIIFLLTAITSSAIGNIIVAGSGKHNINPLVLNSAQLTLGGIVLFIISLPAEGFQQWNFTFEFILALLWLSFVSAAAFSIWFCLLKRDDTTVSGLNLWKFIMPLSGAILSWLLLPEEKPDFLSIAGMVLVTASIVVYYCMNKNKHTTTSCL